MTRVGLASGMDYVIGQVVDKLESKGLMNNTYIIFLADVSITAAQSAALRIALGCSPDSFRGNPDSFRQSR